MNGILRIFIVSYLLVGCATAHSLGNKPVEAEEGSPLPTVALSPEELQEIKDDADVVIEGDVSLRTLGVVGNAIKVHGLDDLNVQDVKKQVNQVLQRVNENAEEGDQVALWEENDRPLSEEQTDTLRKLRELGLVEGPDVDALLDLAAAEGDDEEKEIVPPQPQKRYIGVYVGKDIKLHTRVISGNGSRIRLESKSK